MAIPESFRDEFLVIKRHTNLRLLYSSDLLQRYNGDGLGRASVSDPFTAGTVRCMLPFTGHAARKRCNGSDKTHKHTTLFLFRVRLCGSFPHMRRYGTEPLLLPTSFVAKDATTFSKLGSNSLVKVIIQNKIWMVGPIPSFVHCSMLCNDNHTLHQKSWVVRPNFWGSGPPRPPSGCALGPKHKCP